MNPPSFHIREASEADVPVVARLIRELAEYERLLHEVSMTEERLRGALFGERRYAEVVIAEETAAAEEHGAAEGTVAGGGVPRALGFALFFHNFSTFLGLPGIYLEDLFVRPQNRGSGVGRALLQHVARLAEERGCGRVEWSVLNWNEPAIGFYRRLGARPNDEWTVFRLTGQALRSLAGSIPSPDPAGDS